jgi:hypothetical protein
MIQRNLGEYLEMAQTQEWIEKIVSDKERRTKVETVTALIRADEKHRFDGLIGDFWGDIKGLWGSAFDAYNERTTDPSKKVQYQSLPTGEFTARKPTFPAGEFVAALNKATKRITCDYLYTVFGGKSLSERRILFVGIDENCLFLQSDKGEHIAEERIASFVLADFLQRI